MSEESKTEVTDVEYSPPPAVDMVQSLSQLVEAAQSAFDAKLTALDLEGKLLVVQSDDLSQEMLMTLQEGLKKQGSKVLGIVGLGTDVTLDTLSIEELEEMLEKARKNRDSRA